jgi:PAS domain S-box-containing protein
MGRAFGDAVERAQHQPLGLGGSHLERLIQALPAAIYTTDATGRITFFNEAAAELWGCRPELGKSEFCGSWKLYWPDGRPLPHGECPMAGALKEQRAVRGMEAVAERPDGTRVQFGPYPTPLYDDAGTFIGAVNMLVDISDRKRADINAQKLASIVESSDDAIVSKDLDGIITSWNRGAEQLFGYRAEEVIGKPVSILIPADRLDEEPRILEQIRRGERVDHYETIRRRKDGRLLDISLTVSPIRDADGRIVGASKIARDITERKRAQERQKLVVSEMKHRIKNTLATIQAIATQTLNQHAEERDAFIARR